MGAHRVIAIGPWLAFIGKVEALEREAATLRFAITSRALNQAKNAAGWEQTGDLIQAGQAVRGERYEKRTRARG